MDAWGEVIDLVLVDGVMNAWGLANGSFLSSEAFRLSWADVFDSTVFF